MKSSVVIGQLLDSEGFSDHTAACVEKWFKRNCVPTERQHRQIERIEREIAEWCASLPASKRLLLGKFVGFHKKMGFTAGLHIGLTCMAVKNDKDVDRNCVYERKASRPKKGVESNGIATLDDLLEAE